MGTTAVVLWGPPGCGKTHLAREYIWRHREDYPKGIFWIDCKSEEATYKCFWDIAQAAALLGAADVSEYDHDWDAASKYLSAVRTWFESREGWLIVFDGVTFDTEEEIQAFMKFLPDHKENSVIFTSVDRTLAKRQRLLYPSAVKVSPLSVDDARHLLYNGLDIKLPTSAQENKATELVKYYECLPLAIHATGHMLSAKGKALEKYHIGSHSTSKRLAEPYTEIMQDLWDNDHHEAINLINLLSFFGHTAPVAMLQLGRKALNDFNLEIRSLDRDGSTRRDLETTIATLIKYGLVERTLLSYNCSPKRSGSLRTQTSRVDKVDPSHGLTQDSITQDYERPESSLESSSTRSASYSIDILKIHTVVQGFCRDEMKLKEKGKFWWWLIAAVRLFGLSYSMADERIRATDGHGLVRDYREYETHAAKLYSHFPKDKLSASTDVQKARHDLRKAMRSIKREIESRSPSHSFESARRRVQISVFERTSSSSSNGPDTPTSTPSRSSTWTFEEHSKTESPSQLEYPNRDIIYKAVESDEDSFPDDHGYESGFEDSLRSSIITERRQSIEEVLSSSDHPGDSHDTASSGSRRSSFLLQGIFKGHPIKQKNQRDLGNWRPVPAAPSLSHADIRIEAPKPASRDSSSDGRATRPISASSQAEIALAGIHKVSPPASRGGRIRSRSTAASAESQDYLRQPLTIRSPNQQLSPLASEFDPSHQNLPPKSSKQSSTESTRHHSRNPTVSPRSTNALLDPSQVIDKGKELPPLPVDKDIMITRRIPAFDMQQALPTNDMTRSDILPQQLMYLPSGYTSQPMSRDASHESTYSLATAPATAAAPASSSFSPPQTYSYMRRLGPTGTDASQFGHMGEWVAIEPFTLAPLAPAISLEGDGVVQFGSAAPVNLVEARIRAEELARRLVPFDRGVFRPRRAGDAAPVRAGPAIAATAPVDVAAAAAAAAAEIRGRDETRRAAEEDALFGLGMTFR